MKVVEKVAFYMKSKNHYEKQKPVKKANEVAYEKHLNSQVSQEICISGTYKLENSETLLLLEVAVLFPEE